MQALPVRRTALGNDLAICFEKLSLQHFIAIIRAKEQRSDCLWSACSKSPALNG